MCFPFSSVVLAFYILTCCEGHTDLDWLCFPFLAGSSFAIGMFYFWRCFCLKILSSEPCTYTLVSSHFGSVWSAAEFCLQLTDSRMLVGTVSLLRFCALTGNLGLNQRLLPISYVFHLLCAPFPLPAILRVTPSVLLFLSLGYELHVPFPLLAHPRGQHIPDVGPMYMRAGSVAEPRTPTAVP